MFAAGEPEALAALVGPGEEVALVEAVVAPVPPGLFVASTASCVQMVAHAIADAEPPCVLEPLTEADAPAMRELAALTQPGPFFARTHALGRFVGVKIGGRLVAMAGERMHLPGFHEASAICTHPDHRGRGYAAALTRSVARRMLDEGDTPFLQAYADNAGAIALYGKLGFEVRRDVSFSVLRRA